MLCIATQSYSAISVVTVAKKIFLCKDLFTSVEKTVNGTSMRKTIIDS